MDTIGAFLTYFELQRSISIHSSLHLSFTSINITTYDVFKGKLERDAVISLLRSYSGFRRFPGNFQDELRFLERYELTS